MPANTDRIRTLNDELRKHLLGGGAVMTAGIAALGGEAVQRLVGTIALFDDFCDDAGLVLADDSDSGEFFHVVDGGL